MKCCICDEEIEVLVDRHTGETVWAEGHNAAPVRDGRCCGDCNATVVIPARLQAIYGATREEVDG